MQLQFLTVFQLVLGYGASLPKTQAWHGRMTELRSGRSVSAWPAGEGGAGRRPESTLTDADGATQTAPVTHALYETCSDHN